MLYILSMVEGEVERAKENSQKDLLELSDPSVSLSKEMPSSAIAAASLVAPDPLHAYLCGCHHLPDYS